MVHFVGAGPGAPDLITLRGAELLRGADCVIYAGSLVNPALLGLCRDSARIYDSARMTLEQDVYKRQVVDGVALVDREKCTGCGACAKACPNAIISIIPEHKRKPVVLCQNKDKGAQTRKACSAGCIGCMKCAKACPKQAITVENNLAYIDQEKGVGCGLCAKECPVGVIHVPAAYAQQVMSPAQEEAPAANA